MSRKDDKHYGYSWDYDEEENSEEIEGTEFRPDYRESKQTIRETSSHTRRKKKRLKPTTVFGFIVFEIAFTMSTIFFTLRYGPFTDLRDTAINMVLTSAHSSMANYLFTNEEIAGAQSRNNTVINKEDQNIDYDIDTSNKSDDIKYTTFEVAGVTVHTLEISDPQRVKVGVSAYLGSAGDTGTRGQTVREIAANYDAVAAINGGAFIDQSGSQEWVGNGGTPSGITFSMGENKNHDLGENATNCIAGLTPEGKLIIGEYSLDEVKEKNITHAVSWTPALIINGNPQQITGDGGGGGSSRTAIGQKEDGTIIFLVSESPISGSRISGGLTCKNLQDIFIQLGCVNAMNLDGGKSATLVKDDEVLNQVTNSVGERPVATAFVVVSKDSEYYDK